MKIYRPLLVLASAALLIGCGNPLPFEKGQSIPPPSSIPQVRAPAIGQEWDYIQRDVFQGREIGILKEKVSSIKGNVVISRELLASPQKQGLFSDLILGHASQENGLLANEIQGPWGTLLVDPSWGKVLEFTLGVPIWPENLVNPQSKTYTSQYSAPGMPDQTQSWVSHMKVFGWEHINVPAGDFITLHYENQITYQSLNPSKSACERKESLWFAPAIGRWVVKETSGSCLEVAQTNAPDLQSNYRWELTAWK